MERGFFMGVNGQKNTKYYFPSGDEPLLIAHPVNSSERKNRDGETGKD
jgi:hypothetical protein